MDLEFRRLLAEFQAVMEQAYVPLKEQHVDDEQIDAPNDQVRL